MSHILDDLTTRGLIAQSTDLDALRASLDAGPVPLLRLRPHGRACTSASLMQILTVRRFQQAGHIVRCGPRGRHDRPESRGLA